MGDVAIVVGTTVLAVGGFAAICFIVQAIANTYATETKLENIDRFLRNLEQQSRHGKAEIVSYLRDIDDHVFKLGTKKK